jgi:hypothetical protein
MGALEEFIDSEKQKLNWLQKLSANYPDVTETGVLAQGYAMPEMKPGSTIRPSIYKRSVYFIFSLIMFSGWLFLLSTLGGPRDARASLAVDLVFIPFMLYGSVSLMRKGFIKSTTIRFEWTRQA